MERGGRPDFLLVKGRAEEGSFTSPDSGSFMTVNRLRKELPYFVGSK